MQSPSFPKGQNVKSIEASFCVSNEPRELGSSDVDLLKRELSCAVFLAKKVEI